MCMACNVEEQVNSARKISLKKNCHVQISQHIIDIPRVQLHPPKLASGPPTKRSMENPSPPHEKTRIGE